jgi:hypothetical protein
VSTPAGRRPDPGFLARAFEDDQHAWTRTRRARHRAVLAEVGLLLALVLLVLWAASTEDGWQSTAFAVLWLVGMMAFIPLHSLLNAGIRGLFDRRLRTLDEHQRRLRFESVDRMHWPSQVLTLAASACGIAVVAVTGHTALGLILAFHLWFAAGLLPYWRLSWTLPEEDDLAT